MLFLFKMDFSVFILVFIGNINAISGFSGIYYDDVGLKQTVIQKLLTRQEKREVEHEILNLLGLPNRPRQNQGVHLGTSSSKFLLDVYKSLLDQPGSRTARSEFTLSGKDQQAIDESDVIMSFAPQDKIEGMRHEKGRRLWFDMAEVPVGDRIMGAELRIYQSSNWTFNFNTNSFIVTVYQVINDKFGEHELQYVDSVNTTEVKDDWLVFNMKQPITDWVAMPDTNLGLYISVTSHHHPNREIKPDDIGIVYSKRDEEHQPFMVAFLKSSGVREKKNRETREAHPRRRKKKSENNPGESYSRNPFLNSTNHWPSRSCQIQNLYVSFKDLEWQDWIIAPDGYQAFYCSGECNFPLNAHMNATNHAIVQTLVHLMNPTNVPKPCCAPTKLSAISVLYFLEDSNVILKKYKNMVVKSCGCH